MADKTIREFSTDALQFDLTLGGSPYSLAGKFFRVVIKGANGDPITWDITNNPQRFDVEPGAVTGRVVVHPLNDTFRFELTPYTIFFWVKDGSDSISFPSDKTGFSVDVLSAYGVQP